KEDILFIANTFIQRYCAEEGRSLPTISASGKKALLEYDWPGNVRELENVLERAIVLGEKDTIDADNLLLDLSLLASKPIEIDRPYRELVKDFKRDVVKRALDECGGNQSRAAVKLSLTQPHLSRLMKDLGLR
ncbi:MAG: helix-turn-helix domain-containing protein, partial [bacterium]